MIKFLANKYHWIVGIIVLYFIFNITVRELLIDTVYSIAPYEPVTDAEAYANSTRLRNVFSYILFGSFAFLGLLSLVMLFVPEGKAVGKWILVIVLLLIAFLFLLIYQANGFRVVLG